MPFHFIAFFIFLNFKLLFSKLTWKSQPFFCYAINIFDQHTFGNEATALLKMFQISMEMHFVSLFFLN